MIRILIVDDCKPMRVGFRKLLERHPNWQVCGEAADGQAAIEQAFALQPDVIVLDVNMPVLGGIAALRRIKIVVPISEVLICTVQNDGQTLEQAMQAGARGFLLKHDAPRNLVAAVEAVASHRAFLSPTAVRSGVKRAKVLAGRF